MQAWNGAGSEEKSDRDLHPVLTAVETTQRKAMFANVEDMKEKIRNEIKGKAYDVKDIYRDEGLAQRIARQDWFEYLTLGVILLNAFWIAIETDFNAAPTLLTAHPAIVVGENFFCGYFFWEWLCRFFAFKRKCEGFKDGWFFFDSLLVCMMVIETWVMTLIFALTDTTNSSGMGDASVLRMARLLRLTRMARMVRLLRAVPELMILLKGMAAAMRSVFFTFFLLLIMIYLFGILFTQLAGDDPVLSEHFGSVPESMYTLLMRGAFLEDLLDFTNLMLEQGVFYALIFAVFLMLASLTLMNMLIGVLCEVVSAVASTEKEQLEVAFVKMKLQQLLLTIFPEKSDQVQSGDEIFITKDEYQTMIAKPAAARLLQEVGVDVLGLFDLTDILFDKKRRIIEEENEEDQASETEDHLSFGDLMEKVLELRGSNNATVKDIMNLRRVVRMYIDSRLEKVEKQFPQFIVSKASEARAETAEREREEALKRVAALTATVAKSELVIQEQQDAIEEMHQAWLLAEGGGGVSSGNGIGTGCPPGRLEYAHLMAEDGRGSRHLSPMAAEAPGKKVGCRPQCPAEAIHGVSGASPANSQREQHQQQASCEIPGMCAGNQDEVGAATASQTPTTAGGLSGQQLHLRCSSPRYGSPTQGGQVLSFVKQLQAKVEALDGTLHQVLERLPPRH